MKYEDITACFERFVVSFFAVRFVVKCEIWVIDSLFFLLTIPLTPISRGMNCTGWPVSVMSWMSDEHFSVLCFLAWSSLSSQGHVNSMMVIKGFPEGEASIGSKS